jgi:hypothetical protein
VVQRRRVGVTGGVGEVHVVHAVDGHDVEVDVGHLEAGDHQPDPGGGEGRHLRLADALGDAQQVGVEIGIEVEPVVDLLDRHHQGVAVPQRVDRQEGHAAVVAPHEAPGQLALDDLGEDRRHGPECASPSLGA